MGRINHTLHKLRLLAAPFALNTSIGKDLFQLLDPHFLKIFLQEVDKQKSHVE